MKVHGKSQYHATEKQAKVNSTSNGDSKRFNNNNTIKKSAVNTKLWITPDEIPFTVGEIKNSIPSHLFQKNLFISLAYLLADVAGLVVLYTFAVFCLLDTELIFLGKVFPFLPNFLLKLAYPFLWVAFWYITGSVMTGLFIIGHECGHGAFSEYKLVNEFVGWATHSYVLTPYQSWKISHANHHKFTNSMDDDEVFVPYKAVEFYQRVWKHIDNRKSPVLAFLGVIGMLVFGWPLYLTTNLGGPGKYLKGWNNNHFLPHSSIFHPKDFIPVLIADIGFFSFLGLLCWLSYQYGILTIFFLYGIPYFICYSHLIIITYLQHTATYLPHWGKGKFTWLHGALSTVDRSWGKILDIMFHHISDTHICHHLFPTLPFYNAQEATKYLKEFLGPYYMSDDTNVLLAFWQNFQDCKYVDPFHGNSGLWVYKGCPDGSTVSEKNKDN